MSKMISVASGFQYSVNIGYDLNNDDKLKNFIPTKSALMLLKDILSSTALDATERARVLVGAYGKGKSHIILTILSMLMQRKQSLFTHLMPKINEDPELKQLVDNYYSDKKNRILPVIINGTSGSLPQAFLLALQRTLDENGLDIMPETNYRAAINAIQKWKADYPKTYDKFKKEISLPVDAFISELNDYNAAIYSEFEEVYPKLTSGSIFNPFVGFDVVELYESVVKSLKQRGYLGIYVVYDEFSKFLESNITAASVSDTKMLQDFAEKCNRSSENRFKGKHALRVDQLTGVFDELSKAKLIDRNVDVYTNAPLIGFLYGRTADLDDLKNPETGQIYNQNVMGDRVIYSGDELQYNFWLIMLLDANYEPDEEKRIDKAFRHYGQNPADEERFDSYVRGGIDVLYEKLVEGDSTPEAFANRHYEFIDEFNDRFNSEISSNDILQLCVNKS